jgi:peroxiredoxin
MPYLVAVIGLLSLFNLALTLLVVRWVRRHGEKHSTLRSGFRPAPRLPAGTQIPGFTATTVTGETLGLDSLAGGRSAIAFLSVNCAPCREQLGEFKAYARRVPGGAGQVLAVVVAGKSDPDSAAAFIAELTGTASIVAEALRGPVQSAFSVSGYPSFFVLDERGRVESSAPTVEMLAEAQPV